MGCADFDARLTAFNRRVATAIRTVDRHTLIFYEPNVSFDSGAATYAGALDRGPAGFAFHDYCLAASPNGCPSEPRGFADALVHVAHTHEALLMTEFGANHYRRDLTGMVRRADRDMVPWIEWAYCPCRDPTGVSPDPLVLDPARPPVGSNVGRFALHIFTEPFPQRIAGTPRSWSFDSHLKAFRLRYANVRPSGRGRFGAGAITEIATPRVIYSRPYAVQVRGGAILSEPGAPVLEIAACPGARNISVAVLRRGHNRESCRTTRPTLACRRADVRRKSGHYFRFHGSHQDLGANR